MTPSPARPAYASTKPRLKPSHASRRMADTSAANNYRDHDGRQQACSDANFLHIYMVVLISQSSVRSDLHSMALLTLFI